MTRTIDGLTFRVVSPSLYELMHDWEGVSVVLRFNGFKWVIAYSDFQHDVTRDFKSRDAAIALLVSRRAA